MDGKKVWIKVVKVVVAAVVALMTAAGIAVNIHSEDVDMGDVNVGGDLVIGRRGL